MCGIAGIFDARSRRLIDPTLLAAMTDVLSHRGPDGRGTFLEPGIGLGHRRLAVIDLIGGQQPLFNEDGTVCVVFNGEIYDFRQLMNELIGLGHRFRTNCDTEVIVHAWEEWGGRCVDRFRGMFAFALWDSNCETLFLARDRLGIKPLYYTVLSDGMLAFGSELKSLLLHPLVTRKVDTRAVEEYLAYGYVPDPRSIFENIFKLPPGHTLSVRRHTSIPQPHCYWDVTFSGASRQPERDAAEELRARARAAVQTRLVADVPLGAFLSGGLDSSSVVALMKELSNGPVVTCSISFQDVDFDESHWARTVARSLGTVHTAKMVELDDFSLLDQLSRLFDEPFADSSAIPTYRVSELARRRVTVALSGDGGDEILAGYRRYGRMLSEERMRMLVPEGLRRNVFRSLGRLYPDLAAWPRPFRAKRTFEMLGDNRLEGYFRLVSLLPNSLRRRVLSARAHHDLQGYDAIEVLKKHSAAADVSSSLALAQYLDLKTYLPGDILTKVDRTSMAHALEVRVPLLDHSLVEWTARLPDEYKMVNGTGKLLLRKAVAKDLPKEIISRAKAGFAVPLARWFRGPLRPRMHSIVNGELLNDSGLFDRTALRKIASDHSDGRRDYSAALWALLMFDAFLRDVRPNLTSELRPRYAPIQIRTSS